MDRKPVHRFLCVAPMAGRAPAFLEKEAGWAGPQQPASAISISLTTTLFWPGCSWLHIRLPSIFLQLFAEPEQGRRILFSQNSLDLLLRFLP